MHQKNPRKKRKMTRKRLKKPSSRMLKRRTKQSSFFHVIKLAVLTYYFLIGRKSLVFRKRQLVPICQPPLCQGASKNELDWNPWLFLCKKSMLGIDLFMFDQNEMRSHSSYPEKSFQRVNHARSLLYF